MITGGEGVIEKASDAREQHKISEEKEQISIAVTNAVGKNKRGDLTLLELQEELTSKGAIVSEDGNDFIVQLEDRKNTYLVSEDGNVTWLDTEKVKKINELIGTKVDYTGYTGNYNGSWRIFYASNTEMFIISTTNLEAAALKTTNNDGTISYSGSDDIFSQKTGSGEGYSYSNVIYGAKYNSKWKKLLDEAKMVNNNMNAKATAYLCDPANWTEYISSRAPKGTYAVGAPTVELLALSWEASGRDAGWSSTLDDDVGTGGYHGRKPGGLYDRYYAIRPTIGTVFYSVYIQK